MSNVSDHYNKFHVRRHYKASSETGKVMYAVFRDGKQVSEPKTWNDAHVDRDRLLVLAILPEIETAVVVCPQCEGEGSYADGLDEAACTTECTRCKGDGWVVDTAAIRAALKGADDA